MSLLALQMLWLGRESRLRSLGLRDQVNRLVAPISGVMKMELAETLLWDFPKTLNISG